MNKYYILGGGPAAAFFNSGIMLTDQFEKGFCIVPSNTTNYSPCVSEIPFIRLRKYISGICGNAKVWGGRLRAIDRNTYRLFNELPEAVQSEFVIIASSAFGIRKENIIDLLLPDNFKSEPVAKFADKERFIEFIINNLAKLEQIDDEVNSLSESAIKLTSGQCIKIKREDAVAACMGFFNNFKILSTQTSATYQEHINVVGLCRSSFDKNTFLYGIGMDGTANQKVDKVQTNDFVHEISYGASFRFEQLPLGNILRKYTDILVQVPAHRALSGWRGRIVEKVLKLFTSKEVYKIGIHIDQKVCPEITIEKGNSVVNLHAHNKFNEGLFLKDLVNLLKQHKNLDIFSPVIVDANHPTNSSYEVIKNINRLDTGRISMTGNPTFSLCVLSFCEGYFAGVALN